MAENIIPDHVHGPAATEDPEQATTDSLLARERRHFVRYWSALNEMRIRRELPAWIAEVQPGLGTREELDTHRDATGETDALVNGSTVLSRYFTGSDERSFSLSCRATKECVFSGSPVDLPSAVTDALLELTPRQLRHYASCLQQWVLDAAAREAMARADVEHGCLGNALLH